jgi:putative FmdB family regulatory protein
MPTYRFQCESCGLNFTASRPADTVETKCSCGVIAPRVLPKNVNVAVSGGDVDTSKNATGLSGIDYNWDRAVGENSRKNWKVIAERQREKIDVIQANNVTGWDLSKNPDGTYRVMAPQERVASERSRAFHDKMLGHARKLGWKPT